MGLAETVPALFLLAALYGTSHGLVEGAERALVVDLGGGSLELALGAGTRPDWVASEKLGVLRLSALFGARSALGFRNSDGH